MERDYFGFSSTPAETSLEAKEEEGCSLGFKVPGSRLAHVSRRFITVYRRVSAGDTPCVSSAVCLKRGAGGCRRVEGGRNFDTQLSPSLNTYTSHKPAGRTQLFSGAVVMATVPSAISFLKLDPSFPVSPSLKAAETFGKWFVIDTTGMM